MLLFQAIVSSQETNNIVPNGGGNNSIAIASNLHIASPSVTLAGVPSPGAVLTASFPAIAASSALLPHHTTLLTNATASPNASFAIVPANFAGALASTPNISHVRASHGTPSNITLNQSFGGSPMPGQLLIPSFYSSKSTSGHISFNTTGPRTPVLNAPTGKSSSHSANKSASFSSVKNKSSSSEGHEKITVKLKKSQLASNEMVVVGSPRDIMEQDVR